MAADFVTIVSGLPRSGTSLMMQMLQAGGMELLTDGRRTPDESNPRGYFELEEVKQGAKNLAWLSQAKGKAVKVIHLLLLELPADHDFRIIFMLRNLDEVISSQRAMLTRQGKTNSSLAHAALAGIFQKQLDKVRDWLAARPNFKVIYLDHREVIASPEISAGRLNDFLGGNLVVSNMSAAVIPALHRQRNAIS